MWQHVYVAVFLYYMPECEFVCVKLCGLFLSTASTMTLPFYANSPHGWTKSVTPPETDLHLPWEEPWHKWCFLSVQWWSIKQDMAGHSDTQTIPQSHQQFHLLNSSLCLCWRFFLTVKKKNKNNNQKSWKENKWAACVWFWDRGNKLSLCPLGKSPFLSKMLQKILVVSWNHDFLNGKSTTFLDFN